MQAPNQEIQDPDSIQEKGSNLDSEGTRDGIAYIGSQKPKKRTRSLNNNVNRDAKSDSDNGSVTKGRNLEENLHIVVMERLSGLIDKNGKYNGLIRIITPEFLTNCYFLIKSKPGNMTQGTNKETLDRINTK